MLPQLTAAHVDWIGRVSPAAHADDSNTFSKLQFPMPQSSPTRRCPSAGGRAHGRVTDSISYANLSEHSTRAKPSSGAQALQRPRPVPRLLRWNS